MKFDILDNPPPQRDPASTVDPLDWRRYYLALRDRFWLVVLFTLLGAGLAVYEVNKAIPIYASRAVLMIVPEQENILHIESVRSESLRDEESLNTMLITMTSRTMLERVAKRLDLEHDFVFMPKPAGQEANSFGSVVGSLSECIRASKRGRTLLIDVVAEHTDPETARKLADGLVTEFLRFRFEVQNSSTQLANQFLLEEVNRLKDKLHRSETDLQNFRVQNDMVALEKSIAATDARQSELNKIRGVRSQLEADIDRATQLKSSDPKELLRLPSIANDPSIVAIQQSIAAKKAELAALAQRYKPKHPKYQALAAQIPSLENGLPEAVAKATVSMKDTYATSKLTEEQILKASVQQEKSTYNLEELQGKYNVLRREVDTDLALYNSVLARLKETDLTKSLDKTDVKIVEAALATYTPVRPDKQKILAKWSVGGVGLGLVLALGLYFLDNSIKTVNDVERQLQVPVLSAVTIRKTSAKKSSQPDLETVHSKNSPISESFRTLRSALILIGNADERKIFLFASALPEEGKTFCASNFAVTLAHQGLSTVVIDCDLRKPSLTEIFGGSGNLPGVTDVLAGQKSINEVVQPTGIDNLDVIYGGSRSPNPSELLSGKTFPMMLADLTKTYDRVVIDTAPVLAVSDTLVITPHAQTVCMVIRAHKTSSNAAQRACEALKKSGKTPDGVVLNRLPMSEAGYYYYYSGRYYGQKRVYGEGAS